MDCRNSLILLPFFVFNSKFFLPGPSTEYVGQTNAVLLASLHGHPGYECVQSSSVVDNNSKVMKSLKISYDMYDIGSLKDPPANDVICIPWQAKPVEFGLWKKSTKRPTSDRFFCTN